MKCLASLCCSSLLLIGCGGDDGNTGAIDAPEAAVGCPGSQNPSNPGFICPEEPMTAWTFDNGAWTEVGPADLSCLNTSSADEVLGVDVNLTGLLTDFQTGDPVPDATVEMFAGVDTGNVLATTTSDADGNYALTLPQGNTRYGYRVSAADYMVTYLLNQYFDPAAVDETRDVDAVSQQTADLLPAIIGITRTPGLGVLAAAVRDCAGNEIKGAIATVSSTSGQHEHLAGAQTYYFSGGASPLPTNLTVVQQTNTDGLFVVLELPEAATAYLQVWGFLPDQDPTTDELTLIAEIPAPVVGDTVITASLEPLRQ